MQKKRETFNYTHTRGISWRDSNGKGDAEAEAEPVHGVGKNADANVGDREHDNETYKEKPLNRFGREAKREVAGDEKQAGKKFDGRIYYGDWRIASAAFSAQDEPGNERDIVVGLDGRGAIGATRAGRYDGHAVWNPRDADVQKAADDQAKKKEGCDKHALTVP